MLRIWLLAVLAAALFAVVSGHDVLHRAGLVGHCTSAPRPGGAAGAWRACKKGLLDGRPNLAHQSCQPRGQIGKVEYWRCPARAGAHRVH
jgi:hypothetical protein